MKWVVVIWHDDNGRQGADLINRRKNYCGDKTILQPSFQRPTSKSLGYKSALLFRTMLRISYVILSIFASGELSAQRVPKLCPASYNQTSQVPWANLLKLNSTNFIHFGDLYMLPDYSFVNSSKLKVNIMASSYGAVFSIICFCGGIHRSMFFSFTIY